MSKSDDRLARHEARLDKHEKQIAAIRDLVKEGMRIVVKLGQAQRRTDASLKQLIDSLKHSPGNGHWKRKVDLE